MGGPLELQTELAEDVRQAAVEQGFDDAETYLRWLLSRHEHGQLVDENRVDRMEKRLDELEARLATQDTAPGGPSESDRVQALIDEKLPTPNGADDEAVSNAISEIEQQTQ